MSDRQKAMKLRQEKGPCVGSVCHMGSITGKGCERACEVEMYRNFADFTGADRRFREDEDRPHDGPDSGPVLDTIIWPEVDFKPDAMIVYIPVENLEEEVSYLDGNPKTAAGMKKPDISVVPPAGILHLATAMMNGANKYGPFNWRDKPISTRPYIAAAMRHLMAYLDGEEYSADTVEAGLPVHHLGHVMACCAILLDAREIEGGLNDNRPTVPGPAGRMIEKYNKESVLS